MNEYARLFLTITDGQLGWIETVVRQFQSVHAFWIPSTSNLISDCILQDFGDALRIHHCFSHEPFTKDKFEYALERICNLCSISVFLADKGNPGYDISILGVPISLKTQADRSLRKGFLHISKFMELGKGKWDTDEKDLQGLTLQFINHMKTYDRILMLRTLSKAPKNWHYELVEIPKALLLEARSGIIEMHHTSRQIPRPGTCKVHAQDGSLKFELYFDGGTERKLQLRKIDKRYCHVHAEWKFPAFVLGG